MVVETQCEYCNAQERWPEQCGKTITDTGYEECFINTTDGELIVSGDCVSGTKINYCPMCGRNSNK